METVQLNVAGMTCEGCERSIRKALERVEGVTNVEASHVHGRVEVAADRPLDRDRVAAAIEDAGYQILPDSGQQLPIANG